MTQIRNSIATLAEEVAGWRRELHANPGLTHDEEFAHEFVKARLDELGVSYKAGLGGYGIVASIKGEKVPVSDSEGAERPSATERRRESGAPAEGLRPVSDREPTIGLRADMDALPITEESGQPWASTKPGVMHACGHDGHTACLLGVAKHLSENPNFAGTVHLIFQPAEEGGHGAEKMMADGLFEDFPCDAVFGLHNWPWVPLGQAGITAGPIMAAVDEFDITITGKGGHAALPHACIDPIVTAAQIINAAQTLVSRSIDPVQSAVVSFTDLHAGEGAHNVIPEVTRIMGTVRSFDMDVREDLHSRLVSLVNKTAEINGAKAEINIIRHIDPTINHAPEAEFCADIMAGLIGEENIDRNVAPCMGGEDFGTMIVDRPGAYIWIGQGTGDAASPHDQGLHSAKYDFNDEMIPVAVEYLTRVVEARLN